MLGPTCHGVLVPGRCGKRGNRIESGPIAYPSEHCRTVSTLYCELERMGKCIAKSPGKSFRKGINANAVEAQGHYCSRNAMNELRRIILCIGNVLGRRGRGRGDR